MVTFFSERQEVDQLLQPESMCGPTAKKAKFEA